MIDIVAVDAAGEGFVFELLFDSSYFHVGDGFRWFDQGAGGQEAGQLVAGEENLVEVRDARNAGVLRMAEDGGACFSGPAEALKLADADERVFLGRGVLFVVEVVEQGSGCVESYQTVALTPVIGAGEAEAVSFGFAVGGYAGFDGKGMFAEAFALGPLVEQGEGGLAAEGVFGCDSVRERFAHTAPALPPVNWFDSPLFDLVRVFSGFSDYDSGNLGATLSSYLTIMVPIPQSSNHRGAEEHRGDHALDLRTQPMATALVTPPQTAGPVTGSTSGSVIQMPAREVIRCEHCTLVQFRTRDSLCRRCHKSLDMPEPTVAPGPVPVAGCKPAPETEAGLQVATQVKEIRRARHLSQRQLAGRMQVPRTYISKIENGKAIPTLGSLERLAGALEVDVCQLVRDSRSRREEEVAAIFADTFLAEVAQLLPRLDSLQRTLFLGAVRDKATGQRRTA